MMAEILSRGQENEDKYALSAEKLRERTAELLREKPPTGSFAQVCYQLDGGDPLADIARTIECQVFEPAFGNDAPDMQEQYGPYEQQSQFRLAVDRASVEPMGALRNIKNGPAGFKTLNDLATHFIRVGEILPENAQDFIQELLDHHGITDLDKCWDIGTVAVPPQYRFDKGYLTSIQLYRGMHVAAMTEGIEHFVSMIDANAHRILVKYLGIPFKALGGIGPVAYLGSDKTYPVYGDASEFLKSANRKKKEMRERMQGRAAFELLGKAFGVLVDGTGDEAYQFAINNETLKLE